MSAPAAVRADIDLIITRYHIEAAKKRKRRVQARMDAPRRRAARKGAFDAAFEAAATVADREALQAKAEKGRQAAEQALEERELVRQRMRLGFRNERHVDVGGRIRAPFTEVGLRSDRLGKAGKLFVRACRKAKFLRSAQEKGFICVQSGRKVLNLDFAWVEGNRDMVSLIRVDLDRCFLSFSELRRLLKALVDEGTLPCMPHLVVGDVTDVLTEVDGKAAVLPMLVRPHLWFILPEAVNMRLSGRQAPKRLLDAVYRGLCHALLPLGVDPNAAALLVRGKNPLSPWWQSENFNDESFPSLSEYAAVLGLAMKHSQEQLARMAAEMQSGLPPTVSNVAFNAWKAEAWRLLREWHSRQDRDYFSALRDREQLEALLAAHMPMDRMLTLGEGFTEPRRAAYILDKVIGFAAKQWDPSKADAAASYRSHGRDSHLTDAVETLAEKQAIAGRRTAEARMQEARHAVMQAMDAVERSGSPFTQAEVSRASGMDRKTVSRHWNFCLGRRPRRCVDKKVVTDPATVRLARRSRINRYARVKWGSTRPRKSVDGHLVNHDRPLVSENPSGDAEHAVPDVPNPVAVSILVERPCDVRTAAPASVKRVPVLPPLFMWRDPEARAEEARRRGLLPDGDETPLTGALSLAPHASILPQ